ncbi:ribosome recycling factor [Taibaiella chishuiensis]|uniref:Ribosome-recycling factor n=1 Tax=Taibaiella chishuiensis TaxID=1434707 RepID=A0A2P8D4P2_9BACT|nr:ribosome recycling factor [Taibaiella chishuiensis]PSK92194.1 ribosome recycling factor [Taibaiella chishuiensis]
MTEQVDKVVSNTVELMKKAIGHLESELVKIRAGKANPQMLEGLVVDYYGAPTPINQVANITVADARTITLQPWEKPMIAPIERALMQANLGVTPQNDGVVIRLFMPPLTEERRKELVKRVNGEGEQGKIAIRNIRRDMIEQIKKLQKDGLSEDAAKEAEGRIQGITDKNIALVEQHCKDKDKEIMTI